MAVITKAHGFAHIKVATIGCHLSHQHLNKGRFTRTVVADNTQLLVAGKDIVEIFRNLQLVKTLGDMHCLKDLRANVRGLHIQVHLASLSLLLGSLLQFIIGINAILRFRTPGLRLTTHPIQLLAQQVVRPLHIGVNRLDTLLTFLQVIAIIAFIGIDLLSINLQDLATHPIQEIAIMRHHQDTDRRTAQVILQPFRHLQIQVVGRLIQDDQLRVGDQDIRQGHPLQLPTRELFDTLIKIMDLQLSQDLLRPLLVIPSLQAIHTGQQLLQSAVIALLHRLLISCYQPHRLVGGMEASLQYGQLFRVGGRLLQIAYTQIFAKHDLARIVVFFPGYYI